MTTPYKNYLTSLPGVMKVFPISWKDLYQTNRLLNRFFVKDSRQDYFSVFCLQSGIKTTATQTVDKFCSVHDLFPNPFKKNIKSNVIMPVLIQVQIVAFRTVFFNIENHLVEIDPFRFIEQVRGKLIAG